jgi:hypothetical protein
MKNLLHLFQSHGITANIDISDGENDDVLAGRLAEVSFTLTPTGYITHHNSKLVNCTLGVRCDDSLHHHSDLDKPEKCIDIVPSLPFPNHPFYHEISSNLSREYFNLPETSFFFAFH